MPQRFTWKIEPLRTGWKRSAAQTPIWHVTDDSTSTVVLIAANVTLSFGVFSAHASGAAPRSVKYMAKRPAKNMSSLASQTIVPTDTGFGRLTLTWGLVRGAAVAVDTFVIMADDAPAWDVGPSASPQVNVTPSGSGPSRARRRPDFTRIWPCRRPRRCGVRRRRRAARREPRAMRPGDPIAGLTDRVGRAVPRCPRTSRRRRVRNPLHELHEHGAPRSGSRGPRSAHPAVQRRRGRARAGPARRRASAEARGARHRVGGGGDRRGRHRHHRGRRARPGHPRRRGGQGRRPRPRAPAQGRDLPLPPDARPHRPAAGRLAGLLVQRRRRGQPPARPGRAARGRRGTRRGAGRHPMTEVAAGSQTASWPDLFSTLTARRDLSPEQTSWAMAEIMSGAASTPKVAAFLVGLKTKGESVAELTALADTMLAHAVRIEVPGRTLDIVGTGGDRSHTVNISTMSALVIAGAGITVVKHGNRAASSSSGSADVLEALGIRLDHPPARIAELASEVGI